MLSLRKINPMARAVGTMGIVATMVGAVTFAATTSNTVALDPNTLTSATAALQIGSNAEAFNDVQVAGITATLQPGVPSAPFTFFLKNNGQTDLDVTAHIPTAFVTGVNPADVNLKFDCGAGAVEHTLADWAGGSAAIPGNPLTSGTVWTCTEVATLSSSSTSNGATVQPFRVEFTGTQATPVST